MVVNEFGYQWKLSQELLNFSCPSKPWKALEQIPFKQHMLSQESSTFTPSQGKQQWFVCDWYLRFVSFASWATWSSFCSVKIPDFSAARSSFRRSRESCRINRMFWTRWGFSPKRFSRVFAFCFICLICCSRWRAQCNPRRVWQRQRWHQSIILWPKFAARKPRSPSWGDHTETLPAKSVQPQWTNVTEHSALCDDGLRNRGKSPKWRPQKWKCQSMEWGKICFRAQSTFRSPSKGAAPSNTRIAGIPLRGSRQTGSAEMNSPAVPQQQINNNHQVALTAATLEAWGGKSVTWGKKHAGHKSRMFAKGYCIGHSGKLCWKVTVSCGKPTLLQILRSLPDRCQCKRYALRLSEMPVLRQPSSCLLNRVVRSTLSTEAYSMSSSLDKLTWIRTMWGYIKSPDFDCPNL